MDVKKKMKLQRPGLMNPEKVCKGHFIWFLQELKIWFYPISTLSLAMLFLLRLPRRSSDGRQDYPLAY